MVFGALVIIIDTFTNSLRSFSFEPVFREVRVSFIIVPLVFWIVKDKMHILRSQLLCSMVLGVLLYILYAYGYLTYFYTNIITNRKFEFNHFLIYDLRENLPGAYHHTYIGMYMTFSIVILLYESLQIKKGYLYSIVFFILLNQVGFGSKLTLLLSLAFIGFYSMRYLKKEVGIVFNMFVLIVLVLLVVGFFINESGMVNSLSFSSSNRIESWQCALQGIYSKPFLGYGHEMSVVYMENCITSNAVSTHNQYLEELINYGFFGIWLPVFLMLLFLRSKDDILFKAFLIMIITIGFFENLMSLQRGVLFFVFFSVVFSFRSSNRTRIKQ
ncbi:O-antigen ligase family protein [Zobellia roscoffensis]|uniref:O-antigen ligase family protein n=1 Tax=Zobellia roscoffensis TaxID=2779508 RepID=UPI00188AE603|nr:O-antigen ligase family protein [Zobellia roscoffensis]